jgi:hypothetical protein
LYQPRGKYTRKKTITKNICPLYDYICAIELVPSEEEAYDLCLQCQRLFNGSGDEIGLWA